ncbi:MAG: hybrid sensor histidine kinase/response regulator [Bacteroidetes bacterium]|nr:hybrid sensor histidine kinase/response regulator [Bacteroidota bacterium]MBX7045316.1 hybrid sensor histidine kinase/response regulator [Ignavibacteria bacterium]
MKKILIIEDEDFIRETIQDILDAEGFETNTAENGQIGVEKALGFLPDLIISDIMMPVLDGHGVIRELKKHEATSQIPFIFLTAKSELKDLREGMELGADDYLNKPFTADELINAINVRIQKSEQFQKITETRLDELRSNIIYALPHEMKTALGGIATTVEVLIDMDEAFSKEERFEMYGMIKDSALRLDALIKKNLLYANLEIINSDKAKANDLKLHTTTEVKGCIEEIVNEKSARYRRAEDWNIAIAEDAKIRISKENLLNVLDEIIDNAFRHSKPGNKVHITTSYNDKHSHLDIFVKDEGRGISEENLKKIGAFMQFERGRYEQQGLGLGLIISKKITEVYNGVFEIKSEEGKYTEVRVSFLLDT